MHSMFVKMPINYLTKKKKTNMPMTQRRIWGQMLKLSRVSILDCIAWEHAWFEAHAIVVARRAGVLMGSVLF
jgi:hypothetical protein